ncbi:hypothetical protein [Gilvibacter sp.]
MRKILLLLLVLSALPVSGQEASWAYLRMKPDLPALEDKEANRSSSHRF